jgi:hypothetical protein
MALLLESGSVLLLEDGGALLLEGAGGSALRNFAGSVTPTGALSTVKITGGGGAITTPSTGTIAHDAIARHALAGDYMPAVVIPAPEPPAVPGHVYTIDLCRNWARIAEAPAAVFDGVIHNLALGEWRLSGAVDAVTVEAPYKITDVDTIRVVRDADIVYAGWVAPVTSGVGGLTINADAKGDTFTLTGSDAWSVLASRVAYPTPTTGPPWADGWDIRTGLASTVAAGYITANTGGGTTVDRRIPGLTVVDAGVGLTGSWSGRLQPLDQLVARVCREGGITCRMAVNYSGAITATLRTPNDRRTSIVVSDQGDLIKIEQVRSPASSTFVIAGGQGELTARTFATAGTATGTARREVFSDQSSLSTLTEVQQSANTAFATAAATLTVRADITDATAAGLRFMVDYDIGDTIAVELADVRYPAVIESVTVHVSPDRSVIRPVLGAAAPDLVTGLLRDVANLASRFDTNIA